MLRAQRAKVAARGTGGCLTAWSRAAPSYADPSDSVEGLDQMRGDRLTNRYVLANRTIIDAPSLAQFVRYGYLATALAASRLPKHVR